MTEEKKKQNLLKLKISVPSSNSKPKGEQGEVENFKKPEREAVESKVKAEPENNFESFSKTIEQNKTDHQQSFRGIPQIIESPRNKTTVFPRTNNNFRPRNVSRETQTDNSSFNSDTRNEDLRFEGNRSEQGEERKYNNNYSSPDIQNRPSSTFSANERRYPNNNQADPNRRPPYQYDPNKPRPPYDPNRRPPYQFDPNKPRPPYDPNRRPPYQYDPDRPRPPYDPNRRPPYQFDPNKPRPPYDPNRRPPYQFDPNKPRPPYDPNKANDNRFDRRPVNNNNRPAFNGNRPPNTNPGFNEFAKKQDTYTDRKKKREYEEKTRTRPVETGKDINVTEFVGRVDANHLEIHTFRDSFSRRRTGKDKQKNSVFIKRNIEIFGPMSIKDIAAKMAMRSDEVLSIARKLGLDTNEKKNIIEDNLYIIIEECGHTPIRMDEQNKAKLELPVNRTDTSKEKPRPPIVTVVGHVDHGKTSLLDRIRKSGVAKQEAGGITQSIGAYQVNTEHGTITFIDTPGHEAFTQMRANGVKVTDIAVLVVSAEDSIKPQTIEAITHIKFANVPIIVAITKCDLPTANLEKVKADLLAHHIVCEEYGGDVPCIEVSSVTGKNIDKLLKNILLQAEIMELKANEEVDARAIVLESKIDPKIGAVTTLIVQEGILRNMNYCIANISSGKIKAMRDCNGKIIKEAFPSMPVEVIGFDIPPPAGSKCAHISNMKTAEEILNARRLKHEQETKSVGMSVNLENFAAAETPTINLILRAETQGSLEALKLILSQLNTEKSEVHFILSAVGAIKESDIDLAVISNAHIVGFKTKTPALLRKNAEDKKIKIIEDPIIYNLVDQIKEELLDIIKPEEKEVLTGIARVQQIFSSSKLGNIAGCIVTSGLIKNGMIAKIMRKDKIIATTKIESLKRNKDNAKEVSNGLECGIILGNFDQLNIGDEIHCFKIEIIPNK